MQHASVAPERCPNPNCDGYGHIGGVLGCSICEGKDHPPVVVGQPMPECCTAGLYRREGSPAFAAPFTPPPAIDALWGPRANWMVHPMEVWQCVYSSDPKGSLERVVRWAVEDHGQDRREVIAILYTEAMKARLAGQEAFEDAIFDVLDLLGGWCRPQAAIGCPEMAIVHVDLEAVRRRPRTEAAATTA